MKPILKLELRPGDREELETRARSRTASARDAMRAGIVLARADGLPKRATALRFRTSEVTVQLWTDRYRERGLEGLRDLRSEEHTSELQSR